MVKIKQEKIDAMLDSSVKWAYWIVGILLIGGISYILFNRMNKQVAAVLVFLAGMLALYFYYVKWFVVAGDVWPPMTGGLCPDFMTSTGVGQTRDMIKCEDKTGVTGVASIEVSIDPAKIVDNCNNAATAGLTWLSLCGK